MTLPIDLAQKFYEENKESFNLVYPPYYGKGKNGPFPGCICYLPKANLYEDYRYYKGIYADFDFKRKEIYVYLDGSDIVYLYGERAVQELFEVNEY